MLFIFTNPSISVLLHQFYFPMKRLNGNYFPFCCFWLNRLTTGPRLSLLRAGRARQWWNKLIFVQQRTFITHSAQRCDDIFPFSYKIESHSPQPYTYSVVFPSCAGKVLPRLETNLSYQLLVPGCQRQRCSLLSPEAKSLRSVYLDNLPDRTESS